MPAETRSRILSVIALCAMIGFFHGCNGESGDRDGASSASTWRFAIEEIQGSIQDSYAQKFKELVEEKSEGDIEVTVYPYGSLGTSDEITEQMRMGALQFAMSSPGHLGNVIPEVQVFLLHFLLSEDEEVNLKVLSDEELLRTFDELYRERDLKLLGFFQEGWMVWTTKHEVRSPADFDGVKIRVMTSPLLVSAYKAYGANPVTRPYSEVYSGLQLGMIDGQVNPVFAIEEMSFYEVSDWMIFADHAPFITSVVTNADFYEGLPAARKQIIDEAVAELNEYIFDVQREVNAERLETITENKPDINIVSELTAEEREAFRELSLPVRDEFIDLVGDRGEEILQLILDKVETYESQ